MQLHGPWEMPDGGKVGITRSQGREQKGGGLAKRGQWKRTVTTGKRKHGSATGALPCKELKEQVRTGVLVSCFN